MQEIEVKILEINPKEVEKKLIKLGAKKKFDGMIRSFTLDYPNRSLKKKKCLLRLRTMGETGFVTFKKGMKESKAKICEETEITVSDLEKMRIISEELGLAKVDSMEKTRKSYSLGKVHFEIEKYINKHNNVPAFMEIEAPNTKLIYKYAKLLGFSEKECLPWTAGDVIRYYEKQIKK
jgi:adenylate cyclase class 2